MASSQETNERAARLVGTMLRDKWRLDALIGVGGMAAVYAATHRNGKRAAIKLLSHDLSDSQATRARFLREGYVANKVGHPGVVNVLDDDTSEDGRAFLVMELLEGETLKARWMRWKGRMPVQDVLHIAYQLLDVLAAAHDKGIVHRDIKPDNVFLTNDGALKVLDFGVARLRETETAADVTRSTAMLGTPAFMAPEQARSRWEWVDIRTDVWAVGATMFTALTGQFVHTATTVTELLITAAMQQARPINSVLPDLPESIAAIIDRALAFDQAQRWPDARSMQSAIGLALQTASGFPGQPRPVMRPMQAPASSPGPSQTSLVRPAMASVMEMSRMSAATPMLPGANVVSSPITDSLTQPLDLHTAALAAAQTATPSMHTALLPLAPQAPSSPKPQTPEHTQVTTLYRPPPVSVPTPPVETIPTAPAPVPDSPVVSTLVAAATGSATIYATRPKSNATPLVFAAAGAVLLIGLIAAFFVVQAGKADGSTETNATNAPSATAAPASPPPAKAAPVVETNSSVATTTTEAAPTATNDAPKSTTAPRQTNTTKPRTTPVGTKKRDPFDKY